MMKNFQHIGWRLAFTLPIALLAGLPAFAGESAVLASGFRIHADRHEVSGDMVTLYAGDGSTELPASQIVAFEMDECTAPAPAASPATTVTPAPVLPAVPIIPIVETNQPLDPKRLASDAAKRANLPEALIRSIMHWESGFRPDAISPKGAIGLMQLMPGTAQDLHVDPRDPRQNVEAGTAYLRSLLLKYENQEDQVARAVAAYNAGPAAVDRYNGVPPYRETRDYVYRVLTEYQQSITQSSAQNKAQQRKPGSGARTGASKRPSRLFVRRRTCRRC